MKMDDDIPVIAELAQQLEDELGVYVNTRIGTLELFLECNDTTVSYCRNMGTIPSVAYVRKTGVRGLGKRVPLPSQANQRFQAVLDLALRSFSHL